MMRWSLRLGTAFGIPVYLHWTFILLLGFITVSQTVASGSLVAGLAGLLFVLAIFGSVVLHEFGHALAARRYGIATRDVTLLPIGGIARLERMPDDPRQELWVALAGPAVNVAIAAALALGLSLFGGLALGTGLGLAAGSFAAQLLTVNLILVAFNLLPAFPMDGGRVLRALMAQRMSYVAATDLAATIGRGMAILFGVAGLFWNPMLLFIAFFVWFGAGQEAAIVRQRAGRSRWDNVIDAEIVEPTASRRQHQTYRAGPWVVYRSPWVGDDRS